MSQESRFSASQSSVPPEILHNQDDDFINELNRVDELYFYDYECPESEINSDVENFESDNDDDNVDHLVEPSDDDTREYIAQARFRNDTCGCKEFYGEPCSQIIEMDAVIEFREHCKELSKDELDMIIKAELFAHRCSGSVTEAKKHKIKERERPYQEFYFKGKRVCRQTFCFIHGVEKKKLLSIAKSLDVDGLSPRTHASTGKLPKHALTFQDSERIKTFLIKYATDNALPLPGRLPNYKNHQVLLLPSDKNSVDIHAEYEKLAINMKYRSVSVRTFQRQWHDLCPNIVVTKPCTDLCQKCQEYAGKISNSGNLSEEDKQLLLNQYNIHVQLAKEQRDYYREQVKISKQNYMDLPDALKQSGNSPQSVQTTLHYSWHYAQQVHFPHHSQQVGPIYFKTPRQCNVFGVCSEGSGKQSFYLIDEAESIGEGAHSVVSMVHHYFNKFGHGETDAKIHFDNCTGQNKNNVVLWYALWRVMTGLHKSIEYSMMIAGHTKFEPDWHFVVWKLHWRNSAAETLSEVAETVTRSSRNGHNIPQVVGNIQDPVMFYEWKPYLQQYFKTLKHITDYHHFYMDSQHPGVVTCRENASSES
ncbi:unnamed protein product [Mytilus coruscus]|uniref:DUF7869 domain-containing protein n=1 Tax=Mytilus coruscus TaxID=42192 RepID=A0A6J8EW64_MYTCO|nr:unnamed protein product [Mytilus coruscus]